MRRSAKSVTDSLPKTPLQYSPMAPLAPMPAIISPRTLSRPNSIHDLGIIGKSTHSSRRISTISYESKLTQEMKRLTLSKPTPTVETMMSNSQMHPQIAELIHESSKPKIPTETFRMSPNEYVPRAIMGFMNLGNTCFMNSVLQCLLSINPLMGYFVSGKYKSEISSKSSLGGHLAAAFGDLVQDAMKTTSTSNAISPKQLKRQVERRAPQFSGYNQHDAHEFLSFLLDGLSEDLNRSNSPLKPSFKDADVDALPDDIKALFSWNWYRSRHDSFIFDLFAGQQESTVTCLSCGVKSTTFETFWDLSVPVTKSMGKRPLNSLDECLEEYFREETLDTLYKCDGCKNHVTAKKGFRLFRPPKVLVIHLKRFSHSSYRGMEGKIDSLIAFPVQGLKLNGFASSIKGSETNVVYDLTAISNHSGGLGGGHYTALQKSIDDGQWYLKNDSMVRTVGSGQSSSAYLLFYKQRDEW